MLAVIGHANLAMRDRIIQKSAKVTQLTSRRAMTAGSETDGVASDCGAGSNSRTNGD